MPREDVRAALENGESTSYCPYKGGASWFSVGPHAGPGLEPERRARPDGLLAEVLLEEFAA